MAFVLKILLWPAAILLFSAVASFGEPIRLIQKDWQFGGPFAVTFTGRDIDLDGWITHSELHDFHATYLLPDGSPTIWAFSDIQPDGFMFLDVGNFLIFVSNPDYSLVNVGFEGEVLGSVLDRFLFPLDETQGALTAVPEPNGMAMLGFASLSVLWWRKWHPNVSRNCRFGAQPLGVMTRHLRRASDGGRSHGRRL